MFNAYLILLVLLIYLSVVSMSMAGLVTEMIQATGDTGTQWILDLCNGIVKEGSIPDD